MKRYLVVLVLIAFGTGCVALQRTPEATVLHSLRTIAVIPVETSGRLAPPSPSGGSGGGSGTWRGLGSGAIANPQGAGGLVVGVVGVAVAALVVYGIYRLAHPDGPINPAPFPEGTLTVEQGSLVPNGTLTVDLAKMAAEILQQATARTVYSVEGYLQLPGFDPSQLPADTKASVRTWAIRWHEEEMARRWYHEAVTRTDYSGLGLAELDAILEVGVLQDTGSGALQVMVRLVHPGTKQVLGKAQDRGDPSLPRFLRQTKAARRDLVTRCLADLGLLAE